MLSQPFTIPTLIFLCLSLPLLLGLVPPNRFYGVRTTRTLAEKGLWYRANRWCGLLLVGSGLVYLGVARLLPCAPANTFARFVLHLLAFAVPLFFTLLLLRHQLRKA